MVTLASTNFSGSSMEESLPRAYAGLIWSYSRVPQPCSWKKRLSLMINLAKWAVSPSVALASRGFVLPSIPSFKPFNQASEPEPASGLSTPYFWIDGPCAWLPCARRSSSAFGIRRRPEWAPQKIEAFYPNCATGSCPKSTRRFSVRSARGSWKWVAHPVRPRWPFRPRYPKNLRPSSGMIETRAYSTSFDCGSGFRVRLPATLRNPTDSPAVAFWASCGRVWISAKRAKLCNATPLGIIEQLIARRAFPWHARDDERPDRRGRDTRKRSGRGMEGSDQTEWRRSRKGFLRHRRLILTANTRPRKSSRVRG